MTVDRRGFLRRALLASVALSPALQQCASATSPSGPRLDLGAKRAVVASGRGYPHHREGGSASFRGHINAIGYGSGFTVAGIDYAPLPRQSETEICPVAAGTVIRHDDNQWSGGMELYIAHGLGWKTRYSHLKGRFVAYRRSVARADVIALMGDSGLGARRGGMLLKGEDHLHLTLYGPVYAHLYQDVSRQHRPGEADPLWQHVLDPEEFSLAGAATFLPFQRDEDATYDREFLEKHAEAVVLTDELLAALDDDAAAKARAQSSGERATFAYRVDQRIWFLWQRLERGPHPFSPSQVEEYRAKLTDFMTTIPRFTAPIVESPPRASYRPPTVEPVLYQDPGNFGRPGAPK